MNGSARCCPRATSLRAASLPAAALLAAALLCLAAPAGALTILYTASLNGNLDGCDCRDHPRAGLAARAAWLRGYPQRGEALLVDAGDILDTAPDPELAREILEAYAELGYDAVAVGDQELETGAQAVASWRGRFPLLANNLTLCLEDRCVFFDPQPLVMTRGGETVGLLALLDPRVLALYPEELRRSLKLEEPGQAAAALVSALRARAVDWVVVLYHGPLEEAELLAARVPGIDLVVVGHEQRLVLPRLVNGTMLVSPGEEGNRVGMLTLRKNFLGRTRSTHQFWLCRFDHPRDPQILARLERYRSKLREALKEGNAAAGR
jgi:2',3'-cyclic-nucleotide 2'-phosphodiesterase/3'-nucleotidase